MRTKDILYIFLFLFAGACKNDKKTAVIGKWRPIDMTMRNMSDVSRKEMESSTIEFTKGGDFISNSPRKTEKGTYVFVENTNTLITRFDNERADTVKVTWSGNNMVLTHEDETITLKKE